MQKNWKMIVCIGLLLAGTSSAFADFIGQPILGPLSNGSNVSASTLGASDDNDGWDSGTHKLDIWDGGDDVYLLNWTGGDLTVTLNSLGGSDNDLFIYLPGSLNSSDVYSFRGDFDEVTIPAADPGNYYINIDTTFFSEGEYQLAVTPEPCTIGFLGLGLILAARIRRKA